MPVSTFMTSPVVAIPETAPLAEAARLLRERGISCLAVTDSAGRPAGVLSRTDILRLGRAHARSAGVRALLVLPDRPVADAIRHEIVAVRPETPLADAAEIMVTRRFHRVFVIDRAELVGVLSTRDILPAVERTGIDVPIVDVMTSPAMSVPERVQLAAAADDLARARVRGLNVVDEEGWPVGIFTQAEALAAADLAADTPLEEVMSAGMLCLHVRTSLSRAAAHARETRARRVLAVEVNRVRGVLTGLDFARVASAAAAA